MAVHLPSRAEQADAEVTAGVSRPNTGRRAIVVCDQWLGSDGYAGMRALRRAGWDVRVVSEREYVPVLWRRLPMRALGRLIRRLSVVEFNRELLIQAERLRPEMFLAFKGTFVTAKTLRRLRSMGVRTYCFYPDVSFRAHGPYLPDALPQYDWIFTTKSFGLVDMREQLGVTRASMLLHAFDPDVHRPLQLSARDRELFECDVGFIGTWSPKKERFISAIRVARPHVRVRVGGEFWNNARSPGVDGETIIGRELVGDEYARSIAASRINLGILSERRLGASDGDRITSRTFHIPAAGGFMLHERTEELLNVYTEDIECACFADENELIAKLDVYLTDSARRQEVARRGRELVWSRHSWDHRIRAILDHHESLAE